MIPIFYEPYMMKGQKLLFKQRLLTDLTFNRYKVSNIEFIFTNVSIY